MPNRLDNPAMLGWGEYWAIALRRRWWIVLPMFVCWSAVWGVSWLLPSTYESDAVILLEQQKVPDQYVMSNVTINLQDRLQNITQQILSRTRLQGTIDRYHLYSRRQGLDLFVRPKDPVDQMRDDIRVELVKAPGHPGEFTAFKMHYSAGSPDLAQRVNSELTSLFVNENAESQQQLSEDTTAFLANELTDARVKMEEQEAKVAAFKAKHLGNLPSQMESNVQILAGLEAQLQNTQQALDAARQHNLYSESLLRQYQSAQVNISGGTSMVSPAQALDKDLMEQRFRLQDLKSRYTDNYPDIIALKEKIAQTEKLKKQVDDEMATNLMSRKVTSAAAPVETEGSQTTSSMLIMELQSQLKANQLEIQNNEQHARELESQISEYRARLNLTPETEQQLTDISRGYEESKSNYNSLLQKQMQSQLATSLEQRQKGEQFRIVDPPNFPKKPSGPNHFRLSFGGLFVGLAFGIGLTAFLELADVRVRQEKDLVGIVPVSVLVGIPHLSTPGEVRSRVLRWWTELGAATALVILIVLGNLYAYIRG
jgi:polysaccharide biosynthesis transport protein